MRRSLSASILALSLAIASPARSEEWFRLHMNAPIYFGEGGGEDVPAPGENGLIEFDIEDEQVSGRVYGSLTIPVSISGIDATYTISVVQLAGASWVGDNAVHGKGAVHWPSATQGTHRPTVEVRDAGGALVASAEIEIVIHAPLAAAVPQSVYEVEIGGDLMIVPTTKNAIGDIQWGSTPSGTQLPEWLDFDEATGRIEVDTVEVNSQGSIVLTAVDQADLTSAATMPFSIAVHGGSTDYWLATLGGTGIDHGQSVYAGPDGAVYVAGLTQSAGAGSQDLLVAKYTAAGDLAWKKTLGGATTDYGHGVSVASDGAVYTTGYTTSVGAGSSDLLVAKYSAAGALVWKKTLGGAAADYGYGVSVGSDGAVYVTGSTASAGAGGDDLFVAKYTAAGELAWNKTLGGTSADLGRAVSVGSDGAVYVAGLTQSAGAGSQDLLVAKYTTAGDLARKKTLGGTSTDQGFGISIGNDGSVYVTGYTASAGAGGQDLLVAKYTAAGDLAWKKTLGGATTDYGRAVSVSSDGAVYVTGSTASAGAGGQDLLVARLPSDGGADMLAGSFTWSDANLTANSNPGLTHGANPGLTHGPNPTLTQGANPALTSGDGATLTSTTTQLAEE